MTATYPAPLQEIIDDFQAVPEADRLELLFEFSEELPEVPEKYAGHEDEMEQVVECQTPLFLAVETGKGEDPEVTLVISAPAEAPTTRGFASVVLQGISGFKASEILAVPDDMASQLGLTKALTPLRLRGMSALLGRIKRNITEQLT
ncbi:MULTISPECIES: SufE family protein [Auritidibacter]|uniref:SufE family protein n=1 Tax=Auritidibacter ignavus TaxID=678932 RepID=A0AAJ6APB0_9MICC|nr:MULTISPECIES: SufE family protein [Auritidibacter]PXA80867.1 cysteine desulfuration protein SufE [Auritidibacter sp. NML120779]AXR73448.1 cysteine desulfuration protein SufE [Auritidibacter sp. NML130574]NIH70747.1 cysteine desulfuration protein SufE [Auritidibacter ignavus]PXA77712.1 cysteine desulfuration protein SufE [Auritidibacter sp. NML100628]PXA80349.1 cysteine desulfuration protein SufE [Auritidibacter sp. NML120636]